MTQLPPHSGKSDGRSTDTRENIKKVATELLIKDGLYHTSFRDIADRLAMTTTNIHYHFGNKQQLVEEVVRDYVDSTIARHSEIWLSEERSLVEKMQGAVAFNRERYNRFNKGGKQGRAWSLIGRLRLEGDTLSKEARQALVSFSDALHAMIVDAVEDARRRGELRPDTPVEDIAFLLANMVNSSSVFTQDAGSFERLELYFEVFSRIVLSTFMLEEPPAGH